MLFGNMHITDGSFYNLSKSRSIFWEKIPYFQNILLGGICTYHFFINLLAPELLFFFLILAHSVYKMWIIQEPNMLELWNKLHFEEEKKRRVYTMFKIFSTYICWINT